MKTVGALMKRNVKLFFKDKGTFFTSLITPMILLVLYATIFKNASAQKVRKYACHRYAMYAYIVLFFVWWIVRNIWFKNP